MLRAGFVRPKGTVTNQPRAMPWGTTSSSHATALKGRNKNAVFHGRLGRRDSGELWHLQGIRLSWNQGTQGVALGWLVAAPSGRNSEPRNIENAAARGEAISRSFRTRTTPTPTRRAQVLMLRLGVVVAKGQSKISAERRPGTTFNSDVRALKGRIRIRFFTRDCDVATAENCGAHTGHTLPWNPGSQGVAWAQAYCFPFGAEFGIAQHGKRGSEGGLPFPVPGTRPTPTPTRRAPVLMLRLWLVAPRGDH